MSPLAFFGSLVVDDDLSFSVKMREPAAVRVLLVMLPNNPTIGPSARRFVREFILALISPGNVPPLSVFVPRESGVTLSGCL
jgi:hypothetical protein